jgi:hypothetical protein
MIGVAFDVKRREQRNRDVKNKEFSICKFDSSKKGYSFRTGGSEESGITLNNKPRIEGRDEMEVIWE